MSGTAAKRLLPKLHYNLKPRRNLKNLQGPEGRHTKIRKVVTALFKHERIEVNYHRGDECRGYAERLISEAIRYGDCHKPTMDMASYWLVEKQMVHKLFKVLAPRYKNTTTSYTKMWKAPNVYPSSRPEKCVLELRNNIYPPLGQDNSFNANLLHNVLLAAAKDAYNKEKRLQQENKATEEATNISGTNSALNSEGNSNEGSVEEKLTSKESTSDDLDSSVESSTEKKETSSSESDLDGDLNISKLKITETEDVPSKEKEK